MASGADQIAKSFKKKKDDDDEADIDFLLNDIHKVIIDCFRATRRPAKKDKDVKKPDDTETYDADALSMLHNIQLNINERVTEIHYIQTAAQSAKD